MTLQAGPQGAKRRRFAFSFGPALALLLLAGCVISKTESGEGKKVDIQTPIGGLHVNTDVDVKDIGITAYPGAQRRSGKDESGAHVNISSPMFGLKVAAADFETDDPPEKVLAFYRNDLKKYGEVLECKGMGVDVTANPGESKELTCSGRERDRLGERDRTALKAGTSDRQHAVEVRPHGSGTRFALIYVQTRGKAESM